MSTETQQNDEYSAMDDRITISDDGTTLPVVDLLTGRGFITGKSGSGKSNSASVVIEELLKQGFPLLVVDTDGEYYGLKEQFEMLHVGADEECDLQVGPEHAEKLAELALEQNVPIILDVSGYLDEDEASALIRDTARQLFTKEKKLKRPFLLLVEEVHEYIPEKGGMDETGEMLVKIGKRGRKHGLGLVGISQRPADVKKDFISQADWIVWHRLTWDNDTKVVRRVIDKEHSEEIQNLADGEAFLMADWDDEVRRVQWRRKETFDAGATPGLEDFERPDLKTVSGDLVDELQEISDRKEREQDEIARLERVIEEKDEQIAELEDEVQAAQQNNETVTQLAEQLANISAGEGGAEALEEIREEKNAEIRRLESRAEDLSAKVDALQQERQQLRERVDDLEQRPTTEEMEEAREAAERLADAFDIGGDGEAAKWKRKYETAHERVETLESQNSVDAPDSYEEFVDDGYVQDAIEDAKDEGSPRYVRAVVASILKRGGSVTRREIASDIDLKSDSNIEKGIGPLRERGIVTAEGSGPSKRVDFDLKNVREIHERQARKERTEELMERF